MKTIFLVTTLAVAAQAQTANPMSTELKGMYTSIKNNLIKAAEKMPEESYGFKPSHDIRTFGQLVGHVADAQYLFCTPAHAETDQKKAPGAEKNLTKKTDLVAALKEGFAYCDAAYDSMTDAKATTMGKFFGRERSMMGILSMNASHNNEHYGNIVTYMRIRGLVPPSSEGR
jgi:uncharacterized damage-inducible protein DinB